MVLVFGIAAYYRAATLLTVICSTSGTAYSAVLTRKAVLSKGPTSLELEPLSSSHITLYTTIPDMKVRLDLGRGGSVTYGGERMGLE